MKLIKKVSEDFIKILPILIILFSCSENDTTVAPYIGSPSMSTITIEQNSYKPKITWIGGYVSTIGVNRSEFAKLDSSIIWIAYNPPNSIKYPIEFGTFPNGAIDIINDYQGKYKDILTEDNVYTFWIIKDEVWQSISNETGKFISVDTNMIGDNYWIDNDTVKIAEDYHTQITYPLDVYINIDWNNTQSFGRLGEIIIEQTDTSNNLLVEWNIIQSGITDSSISAMGICLGSQYDINSLIWEIWSEEIVDSETVFGKKNVIYQPLILGQEFSETRVFGEWLDSGLERNQTYYLWIASKEWDGEKRGRAVDGYAYMKLATW